MTQPDPTNPPADPAPAPTSPPVAAPAADPANPTPAPPAPPAPAAAELSQEDKDALIAKLRKEAADANGKARETARAEAGKAAEEAIIQKIGTALGLIETPTDPAALAEQVAASTAAAKQAKLELAVYQAANASNVDAAALLDSRTFLARIADADPTDTTAIAAAIGEFATANPALARTITPGVPAPNPAQGSSAGGPTPTLQTQIAQAEQAGDWALARRLKAQQIYAHNAS